MADTPAPDVRRVAVAGIGSVGMRVAHALDAGIPGLALAAVSARDLEAARGRLAGFSQAPRVLELEALAADADIDIMVECLPPAMFRAIAEPVLARGAVLVAASVGALVEHDDLPDLARRNGGRVVAPSGAVAGLDALAAAREAGLESVRLVTRKPPAGFGASLETEEARVATADIAGPLRVFAGTAREAVRRFPKNVNVAATVSLAGLGPDRTLVEVWADPGVSANQHELAIRSAAGEVDLRCHNLPDPDNPASSAVTGHSMVAALRRLAAPLVVGS